MQSDVMKKKPNKNHNTTTYVLQGGEICNEHLQMEKDNVGGTAHTATI